MYTLDLLNTLPKQHDTFVGIDSDGCVFDSMVLKQTHCFHGELVKRWGLETIEPQVREVAEYVNLYSPWRGLNRFQNILKTFELLAERMDVQESGVPLPMTKTLQAFVESGDPLSRESLDRWINQHPDDETLHTLHAWTIAVDENVANLSEPAKVFCPVRAALDRMQPTSDLIVISQTPTATVAREWENSDLVGYIRFIAGPELGTKAQHLQLAVNKYGADRVILLGDAPGDWKAAQTANCSFYPINPGHEEESWKSWLHKDYDRFVNGQFDQTYQMKLVQTFESLLPDTPPWEIRR